MNFFKKLLCLATIILFSEQRELQIASRDYLDGKGLFNQSNLAIEWLQTPNDDQTFTIKKKDNSNEHFLWIQKPDSSESSFEKGLYASLNGLVMPKHVRFSFASSNIHTEDTNLRIMNSDDKSTLISFRCGYNGFMRVNGNQIVGFYNRSESTVDNIRWTKVDLVLLEAEEQVRIYINGTALKENTNFYDRNVKMVNKVMLYNLKPGTQSFFKDIEVCAPDLCPGAVLSDSFILQNCFTMFVMLFLFSHLQ